MRRLIITGLFTLLAITANAAERYTLIIQYQGKSRAVEMTDVKACRKAAMDAATKTPGSIVLCLPSSKNTALDK